MSYLCTLPTDAMSSDYVDDGHGGYKGQCVSLLKKMCASIPSTSHWKKGVAVKNNTKLAQGTAIASFNPKTSKYWHAAIYVRQDSEGIWVWDQYVTGKTAHAPKLNRLRWVNAGYPHVAGDNFCVID